MAKTFLRNPSNAHYSDAVSQLSRGRISETTVVLRRRPALRRHARNYQAVSYRFKPANGVGNSPAPPPAGRCSTLTPPLIASPRSSRRRNRYYLLAFDVGRPTANGRMRRVESRSTVRASKSGRDEATILPALPAVTTARSAPRDRVATDIAGLLPNSALPLTIARVPEQQYFETRACVLRKRSVKPLYLNS